MFSLPGSVYTKALQKEMKDSGPFYSFINVVCPFMIVIAGFIPLPVAIPVFLLGMSHFILAWKKTEPLPDEIFGKRYGDYSQEKIMVNK